MVETGLIHAWPMNNNNYYTVVMHFHTVIHFSHLYHQLALQSSTTLAAQYS